MGEREYGGTWDIWCGSQTVIEFIAESIEMGARTVLQAVEMHVAKNTEQEDTDEIEDIEYQLFYYIHAMYELAEETPSIPWQ